MRFDDHNIETVQSIDCFFLNIHRTIVFTKPKNIYLGRSLWYSSHVNEIDGIEILSIGQYVKEIGNGRLNTKDLKTLYSFIEEPDKVSVTFNSAAYANAKLYVPTGTIEKYKAANNWKDFFLIEEMDVSKMWNGEGEPKNNTDPVQKCEKPTISYENGQLKFASATNGAEFISEITDSDIKKNYEATVLLTATYNISVYATKSGYENSETSTATLC